MRLGLVAVIAALCGAMFNGVGSAAPIGNDAFFRIWVQTDRAVAEGRANRTWMWGPEAGVDPLLEQYAESPGGWRLVQYFDKSRMEITHPDDDPGSAWYVTNGLLAEELITGRMQVGDSAFEQYAPAQVNVSGDLDDPDGPTYATFNSLMINAPLPSGWTITQTVTRSGQVGGDIGLSSFDVTAVDVQSPTNHTVASVFWDFMTHTGYDNPF